MGKKQLDKEQRQEFNGEIQAIFKGGKINAINWGADSENSGWSKWDIEKRLSYAMELASAMNQAADIMQKERNILLDEKATLEGQLKSAEESTLISKTIMTTNIMESNRKHQEFAEDIKELHNEIAVLKAFNNADINKI